MHRSLWVSVAHSSFIDELHTTKNTASGCFPETRRMFYRLRLVRRDFGQVGDEPRQVADDKDEDDEDGDPGQPNICGPSYKTFWPVI
jgi:hypothetical protein